MQPLGDDLHFQRTRPANGPHLVDVSAFWNPSGGVHRVLATKAAWLVDHAWRHTLVAPGATGNDRVDCGGLPLPGSGGYRMVLDRGRAERLLEWLEPDLVEAADPYTLAWAALGASQRLRVPAVAFCHSDLPLLLARLVGGTQGLRSGRGRWVARRARHYLVNLYEQFDMVLAPSQSMARRLAAWGVGRVLVQPLGVDCHTFNPAARDPLWRLRLCQQLGLHPTVRLLVYTGRFAPEKNLQLLADAVGLLGTGHALLCVGSGPRPPQGRGVHLLPVEHSSERLARLVASCDAYVHAGDQETFGLGALEAMACGTPVVVSASGGLGELAHDVGITVGRRNAQEWAEAISACLLAGPSALRAAGLARARLHDWPVVLDTLERRYLTLLRRHGRLDDRRAPAAHALPRQAALRAAARMGSPMAPAPRLQPRWQA